MPQNLMATIAWALIKSVHLVWEDDQLWVRIWGRCLFPLGLCLIAGLRWLSKVVIDSGLPVFGIVCDNFRELVRLHSLHSELENLVVINCQVFSHSDQSCPLLCLVVTTLLVFGETWLPVENVFWRNLITRQECLFDKLDYPPRMSFGQTWLPAGNVFSAVLITHQ